jgi:MoaA/NifB/PqqE/SkfB family radical SAM enzyme
MCEKSLAPDHHYDDMTVDEFKKILDQFPSVTALSLTGIGEPFLNKNLLKMVSYAKSKGIFVSLTSNGTMISEGIVSGILDSGLDDLSFSIESADPETYEKIRVGAKFDQVTGNIARFMRMKEESGSRTPDVTLRTVVMSYTVDEVPGLINLAHKLGVNRVLVATLLYSFKEDLKDPESDIMEAVHTRSMKLAKQLSVKLEWELVYRGKFSPGSCTVPFHTPYVFKEGYVGPCCFATQRNAREEIIQSYTFGNVLEEDFSKILNNEKFKSFRRKLLSSDLNEIPGICKGCWMLFKSPADR